jgi:hypothetical protein
LKSLKTLKSQQNKTALQCRLSNTLLPASKKSDNVFAPKQVEPNTKPTLLYGLTPRQEIDAYFIQKYDQLESTTTKIINKYNRKLQAANVISAAYIFVVQKEPEIVDFSRRFSKSIEHTIYSFTIKYINNVLMWRNDKVNTDENKFINTTINIDDETSECIEYQKTTNYQHNIYSERFIEDFYVSLNKIDSISFFAFYFEGYDNAEAYSEKFNISISSAYADINKLKALLKTYIQIHKIE